MSKKLIQNRFFYLLILIAVSFSIKFVSDKFLTESYSDAVRFFSIALILISGAFFVINGTAKIIEETTAVLSFKTRLAGGLLQSFGTAFPDMVLGVAAALISLRLRSTDLTKAINFAVIAASTTFGSNIYNVGHAAWCIYRQNLANKKDTLIAMFPLIKRGGSLKPMKDHIKKPSLIEMDTAINISVALTLLTSLVAVSMVVFGKYPVALSDIHGDLYQLIKPAGLFIFLASCFILFRFRRSERIETEIDENNYYSKRGNMEIWISLLLSGIAILFTAEAMVKAIEVFCEITKTPFVVAGVLAGIMGCLGEIFVIHNFSVNPKGRIGDAVVGVAMDNIVTILGASIVAMMGGIFLGGNSLILIFVIILTLNSFLIWQISILKNFFIQTP